MNLFSRDWELFEDVFLPLAWGTVTYFVMLQCAHLQRPKILRFQCVENGANAQEK